MNCKTTLIEILKQQTEKNWLVNYSNLNLLQLIQELALELKNLVSKQAGIDELEAFYDLVQDAEGVILDPKERQALEAVVQEAVNQEIKRADNLEAAKQILDAETTVQIKRAEVTEKEKQNLNPLSSLLA